MLQQLRDLMERDYAGTFKKKLDDVYRSAGTSGPTNRGEKADRENRVAFIVSMILLLSQPAVPDGVYTDHSK